MLTLVSGPFFPHLEKAFLQHVESLRNEGSPIVRLAIIAPSARLMERLQLAVAREGVSLMGAQFMNFSSLAQSIISDEEPLGKPVLSDPLFYDTLVKVILKERKPFHRFEDMAVPEGFPPAVRSTLRDLMDAGVSPLLKDDDDEKLIAHGLDVGILKELMALYRFYMERMESLPFLHRSALVKRAVELAPQSRFLKSFQQIIYYGFYDLTGLQSDFFEAVVKNHPSVFFFPYDSTNPAYAFAKNFRDSIIQRILPEEQVLTSTGEIPPRVIPSPHISLVNVSGLRDEAWAVAGELVRLHEEKKIPWHEMAVVSRNRQRLEEKLMGALRARRIPLRSSFGRTLHDAPQIDVALRFLGDWGKDQPVDKDVERFPELDASVLTLRLDMALFPEEDSWSGFANKAHVLLEKAFHPELALSKECWALLFEALDSLSLFDPIGSNPRRDEFLSALKERWMTIERPLEEDTPAGVSLLYAEAARGLRFRAVFLVGLEEKVFPRIVREDPFLRDKTRLALYNTVGNKIGQKMSALEEEKLLFHMLTESAEEFLTLVWQRTDDDGKFVGLSSYLRAFAQAHHLDLDKDVLSVARPFYSKLNTVADPSRVNGQEALAGYLMAGDHASAATLAAYLNAPLHGQLTAGLACLNALHETRKPGSFDGLVDPKHLHAQGRLKHLSPSALETFGLCPYKYFATRVLDLKPPEEEDVTQAWPPDVRGKVIHEFFRDFYSALTEKGKKDLPAEFPTTLFNTVFEEKIGRIPAEEAKLHPVFWEAEKRNVRQELERFIEWDLAEAKERNVRPAYFETDVIAQFPAPLDKVDWMGRIDRIDVGDHEARVMDYKTGKGWSGNSIELESVRGKRLQAPLYLLLAQEFLKKSKQDRDELNFTYAFVRDPEEENRELSHSSWQTNKAAILDTIKEQIDLMRGGRFLILPEDSYCSYCDVAQICRRQHSLSVYRAEQGEGQAYKKIREKTISRKGASKK